MPKIEPAELREEIDRLAAEALALRVTLGHVFARLSTTGDPDVAAAIQRGLEDAQRALQTRREGQGLKAAGAAAALSLVEALKAATLRPARPGDGFKDEPGAFHAESNDEWPEDDY